MTFWAVVGLCGALSFASGSVPFGLILGKHKGIDIRNIGSGNIGAMNIARALGGRWFWVVFALDLMKGLASTLTCGWLLSQPWTGATVSPAMRDVCWLAAGLFAVLGHNYSPFVGFKGGKGVSTSLGVSLGIYPDLAIPALCCFFVWALGISSTRISSVGSLLGGVMFPLFYVAFAKWSGRSAGVSVPFFVFTLIIAGLIVIRHRANIARIFSGTEPRIAPRDRGGSPSSTIDS